MFREILQGRVYSKFWPDRQLAEWQHLLVARRCAQFGRIELIKYLPFDSTNQHWSSIMQTAAIFNQSIFLTHFNIKFDQDGQYAPSLIPEWHQKTLLPSVVALNERAIQTSSIFLKRFTRSYFYNGFDMAEFLMDSLRRGQIDVIDRVRPDTTLVQEMLRKFETKSLLFLVEYGGYQGDRLHSTILAESLFKHLVSNTVFSFESAFTKVIRCLYDIGHRMDRFLAYATYWDDSSLIFTSLEKYCFSQKEIDLARRVALYMGRITLAKYLDVFLKKKSHDTSFSDINSEEFNYPMYLPPEQRSSYSFMDFGEWNQIVPQSGDESGATFFEYTTQSEVDDSLEAFLKRCPN